jgi:hypothetical protein
LVSRSGWGESAAEEDNRAQRRRAVVATLAIALRAVDIFHLALSAALNSRALPVRFEVAGPRQS